MGMDATMILVSREKDKIERLRDYFNDLADSDKTYEEEEAAGLIPLMFYDRNELVEVCNYYAVRYDLRKALESEIYGRIKQDSKIDMLEGVAVFYFNDYNDEVFATRDGNDEVSVAIGDYVNEEIYVERGYDDLPLEDIFKKICDWKNPVFVHR